MATHDIRIREARPDDAEAILDLVRRLLEEPGRHVPLDPDEWTIGLDEQRRALATFQEEENSVCLVAESDGRLVGELNLRGLRRRALRHVAILGMSVAREWRRRGVGDRLVGHAIGWARRAGVLRRIELHVYVSNEPAIRLYTKHGFAIEGRRRSLIRRQDAFEDDYVMGLLLEPGVP